MKYKAIKGLDKQVSSIVFGSAGAAFIEGRDQNSLLDEILDLGINTIDTARNYGLSEKTIGMWFKNSGKRDDVVLLSKAGHPDTQTLKDRISAKEIREDLECSLNYLNTSYIDLYVLHRDDKNVPVEEIVEIMNKLHEEGKIILYGVSNWTKERIISANTYAQKKGLLPISLSSPNYCVAQKVLNPWIGECVSLCGKENVLEKEFYENSQMPVFAYSSLGRGFFSGKIKSTDKNIETKLDEYALKSFYNKENIDVLKKCEILAKERNCSVSNIALAYLFSTNTNVFPIISSSNPNRIKDNIKALAIQLSKEEKDYLEK